MIEVLNMNPNSGREAAYVTSRVVDNSGIQAPTEYLPLFTCLAPKGNSIEPILIRDVDNLIEEFGDPSVNPNLYRDLITIRDFVKADHSCWVNRVAVEAKRFHSEVSINSSSTIPSDIDPFLFNMDSMLLGLDHNVLTFTSTSFLVPSSAGIRIKYVLSGFDITGTDFLIEETVTLPNNFTDGQFALELNKNPYIEIFVNNPDSLNIYNALVGGYLSDITIQESYDTDFNITLEDYQKSIQQYIDPKYYGNFLCDLSYPCAKDLSLIELTPDDRRAVHFTIKTIASQRKDLICILTTPDLPIEDACNWVAARKEYQDYWEYGNTNAVDYSEQSFYCEMYYGWVSYRTALVNGTPYKINKLPSNIFVIKNIIDSWMTNGISFPVAGNQGGVLTENTTLMNMLHNPDTKAKRDTLVSYRINPIWDTGSQGIQIYGNETLNPLYTDLSAAHIARMLVMIKSRVDAYSETIKFSLNNQLTWGTWITYVTQYILEPIKAEGGLVWYQVRMGLDTTKPSEIANRKIRGMISLQFQQDLEIVDLEYTVYASSLELESSL